MMVYRLGWYKGRLLYMVDVGCYDILQSIQLSKRDITTSDYRLTHILYDSQQCRIRLTSLSIFF